jgi:hypothetical protein
VANAGEEIFPGTIETEIDYRGVSFAEMVEKGVPEGDGGLRGCLTEQNRVARPESSEESVEIRDTGGKSGCHPGNRNHSPQM